MEEGIVARESDFQSQGGSVFVVCLEWLMTLAVDEKRCGQMCQLSRAIGSTDLTQALEAQSAQAHPRYLFSPCSDLGRGGKKKKGKEKRERKREKGRKRANLEGGYNQLWLNIVPHNPSLN